MFKPLGALAVPALAATAALTVYAITNQPESMIDPKGPPIAVHSLVKFRVQLVSEHQAAGAGSRLERSQGSTMKTEPSVWTRRTGESPAIRLSQYAGPPGPRTVTVWARGFPRSTPIAVVWSRPDGRTTASAVTRSGRAGGFKLTLAVSALSPARYRVTARTIGANSGRRASAVAGVAFVVGVSPTLRAHYASRKRPGRLRVRGDGFIGRMRLAVLARHIGGREALHRFVVPDTKGSFSVRLNGLHLEPGQYILTAGSARHPGFEHALTYFVVLF